MDFHRLVDRLKELEQPAVQPTVEQTVSPEIEECGEAMAVDSPTTPPATPPNMSVNLNAQGMDSIEQILKLISKVNPDTINPSTSAVSSAPSVQSLTQLPIDTDIDTDDSIEFSIPTSPCDSVSKEGLTFDSATTRPDPEVKDVDYMVNRLAGGMNKPKGTYPKVAAGDNPMQKVKEGDDLREQIRAELMQRLNEAKTPSAGLSKEKKSEVVKKAKTDKDIGKKGKGFKEVEAAAKKGGATDPTAVAAAAMWKNIPKK
jgi:hypothetical protein